MTWGSDMSNAQQQQTPQSYVAATPEPAVMRAIENLSYEWARSIDENRLEDLAGLLTEQCDYKIASPRCVWPTSMNPITSGIWSAAYR